MKIRVPEENVEVSLTPLIDAVFLLLVFFLVATMAKKNTKDVDILLPESASAERLRPDDNRFVVALDAQGGIYVEGVPSTLSTLHAELKRLSVEAPERQVRLDVDQKTPASAVVEIVNLCQFRGILNVGIRTYDENYGRR